MAGSLVLRCLHGWLQRRGGRGGRGQLDLAYGIALLVLQHGWHSAIVLVLLAISYSAGWLTKGTRYRIGASWAVGIGTILLKESYRIKRHFTVVCYCV